MVSRAIALKGVSVARTCYLPGCKTEVCFVGLCADHLGKHIIYAPKEGKTLAYFEGGTLDGQSKNVPEGDVFVFDGLTYRKTFNTKELTGATATVWRLDLPMDCDGTSPAPECFLCGRPDEAGHPDKCEERTII